MGGLGAVRGVGDVDQVAVGEDIDLGDLAHLDEVAADIKNAQHLLRAPEAAGQDRRQIRRFGIEPIQQGAEVPGEGADLVFSGMGDRGVR